MKNLFFLIGIFFSINISAQLTYVPDVNFEIALANLGYDNGVLDHYVPTANINSIPYLYIPSKGISDLTGIEDFVSLTLLNCASNNLSSINISNNTALTTFSCAGNNLTSLDVSNNTLLTLLTISNNQITSIDLSTNNLLERIYFSNNLIETIDLNSKPFLTEVSLENNALSSFNIKNGNNTLITDINLLNNPDLYCVEVDNITYSNTNWLNKDAQTKFRNSCAQTYIPDANFEQELINLGYDTILDSYVYTEDIEQITNLNISSKGIIDLTGIADFINLRYLDVSNNIIAILDLSQNTFLITLNCSNNQITTLNLGSLPGLVLLDCNTNLLSALNLNSLIGLRNLNCSNNNLTNLNISNNMFLKYLYCGNNQLTSLDVSSNLSLIYLSCVNNQITSLDISNNISLADLRCRNNLLTTLNTATNINLTDLVCQYNLITDLDLSNNTALTRLLCQNNKLTDLNIKNGNNSSITNLDFNASNNSNLFCIQVDNSTYSNNYWSQKDGQSIFRNSCAKTYVPDDNFEQALIDAGLDNNPVLDDYIYTEVANITTGLFFNSKNISNLTGIEDFISLTHLNLNNNNLTNIDLSFCLNLQYVYLNNNAFTNLDLSANPLLLQLTCNGNQLTELNLNTNNLLYILHCSNNQITNLDLSFNTQLVELFCDTNQLTSLNFKNGYNSHTANTNFIATSNPNLFCIEVDDAVYSTINWSNIDAQSSFSTNCHYFETYVPDNNFEQELINLGYDTILDDYVTTANINTITSINLNAKNISDLTGIEDFTALQTLYCQNNNITTLDTSNNPSLEILNCASNQITSMDLSQNTSLTDLNCSDNLLTNLNVFHNTVLTNLDCNTNQISGLNLVTNTSLSALNCSHNLLIGLILTNGNNTAISNANYDSTYNASLTCIEVDDVAYSSTNWANIDFHASFSTNCHYGETYVPDDNFEQELINLGYDTVLDDYVITANINTVGLLDVSFKSINDLTGIDGFAALTQLFCNNNNISTLDLSKNVMLNYLNCSFNSIDDIYITSPNLIYLSASNNQLLDMDLSNKLFLTFLELNNNSLNSLNIKNGNNTSITNFNIINNPNLLCVQVDDIAYSITNWTNKDAHTSYNINCSYPSIWRTAHWINGTPNLGKNAVIDDIYNTGAFGNINAFQLTVEPTKTVTVSPNSFIRVNSNVINNGELIIEHEGSFVQILNTATAGGTGLYTVKNKTTLLADADRFTYFSSPVANENLNTFSPWANTNKLFSFNAFAQSWFPEISSTIMQQSKGYIAKGKPDVGQYPFRGETNFKGNFNNGIFSVPLHYTASSPSMDDDNTLVGNPYPSAVNATLLLNNNPQANAFYFWTHKSGILPNGTAYAGDDYAIWNNSGGIASASGSPAPSGFIASCQGFFVDANASGTLTFDNAYRVTGNNDDFRRPNIENRERIWINLEHEDYGVFNQILLNFNENGTTNFDAKLDAVRFNTGNAISFYSNGAYQEHFAIQTLPLLTEDTIVPLGFEVNNSNINHLKIVIDHNEINTNTIVYLKDNQENVLHSLSYSEYNFTTTEGYYPNRFELIFRRDALSNPQEITNTESLIVSNYSKKEIKISTKNGANYTQIRIFDILGKEIISKNQLHTNSTILNSNIKQGTVLFIKVQLENGKIIMKKFLKI